MSCIHATSTRSSKRATCSNAQSDSWSHSRAFSNAAASSRPSVSLARLPLQASAACPRGGFSSSGLILAGDLGQDLLHPALAHGLRPAFLRLALEQRNRRIDVLAPHLLGCVPLPLEPRRQFEPRLLI